MESGATHITVNCKRLERQRKVGKVMANNKKHQEFEKVLLRKEKLDIEQNVRIVEALYDEAVALGAIPGGVLFMD